MRAPSAILDVQSVLKTQAAAVKRLTDKKRVSIAQSGWKIGIGRSEGSEEQMDELPRRRRHLCLIASQETNTPNAEMINVSVP
ncbi:MAG: hypothetical protein CMK06_06830 [Ponticaulis sp.]|nr:hypothetical protein [Ponticaulis sp.]|tara:strand:+ start:8478 stop:8726 length:249 start_codon:yes stop_codon:yes gene_type:complete